MRHFPEADPGRPDIRSPRRYLLWLALEQRAPALGALAYGVVCTLSQALVPLALGKGIDEGLVHRDERALLWWGSAILALGVLQAITGTLRDRCSLTNRLGASYRTMQLVTGKAVDLGVELPRRVSTGSVVSVGTTDLTRIGAALESTARGSGAVVSIVMVAALMLTQSLRLGLICLVGVPLIAWAAARLVRLLHRAQHELRTEQGHLADLSVDIVSGLRVLRGIGGEDVFSSRYRDQSQRVRALGVRVASVEGRVAAGRLLLPGLLTTAIVWQGAELVAGGTMSAGALVAFYGYAVFLAEQLRRATGMLDQLTRGAVSAEHVTGFLALDRHLHDGPLPAPAGDGTLHDPDTKITLPGGGLTAVACAVAADALPIAERLGRYTESSGTALDGVPLRELSLNEVRRNILIVDHGSRLFAGTLRDQLDPHGTAVTAPDRLRHALDAACAHDVVDALPDGLDQQITGSGDFSGGQLQRLVLARALLMDPAVLILIEPTSALDAHTEGRIAERLGGYRAGRSTVVFTTSPALLGRADHVVHVEDGAATATGRHDELITDVRYRATVTREAAV
ncbi:ABC transporter ATP-binding protein [Streptomyces sp. ME08-AFT2]|uniref:ABC transporter ATP-binding protein n=1 Tax=Streptomyces sp. ME08-AFT2 TaxID=3028683 RepID=UPI0029AABA3A|nr:ABC transporter ATP-binding protein [Streptomyces sp. ME08-AFT2]MDX3312442.1 ABC transporter ATP-binding protein [Streptomyces sp. ME08-AFT2]